MVPSHPTYLDQDSRVSELSPRLLDLQSVRAEYIPDLLKTKIQVSELSVHVLSRTADLPSASCCSVASHWTGWASLLLYKERFNLQGPN